MSLVILISEKGGEERREAFERDEISVGRVQGNDLMLPKGNVSKRHAKLTFRDGRFLVSDLKSTNGTYVNGRKITQSTVVREGDKIYVGDYVLRFEAPPGAALAPESQSQASDRDRERSGERVDLLRHDSVASEVMPSTSQGPASDELALGRVPQAPPLPMVSGSRAGPSGTQLLQALGNSASMTPQAISQAGQTSPPPGTPTAPPPQFHLQAHVQPPTVQSALAAQLTPAVRPQLGRTLPLAPTPIVQPALSTTMPEARRSTPTSDSFRNGSDARRLALALVAARVADAIDLSPLAGGALADDNHALHISRTVREVVTRLRGSGELNESVDGELLVRDIERELLAVGPLGALLDDEEVTEIHALRFDRLSVVRSGQRVAVEPGFASDESLRRTLARLAWYAGEPLDGGEHVFERTVAGRAHLVAALAPMATSGTTFALRKPRRETGAVDELVRSGVISRGIATFLGQCSLTRANVLVVAPQDAQTAPLLLTALAAASEGERCIALLGRDDAAPEHPMLSSLVLPDKGERGAAIAQAAALMRPDRMLVGAFSRHVAGAVLDGIAEGARGVFAIARGTSLRPALARIAAELAASRVGLSIEVAREQLATSFDVVCEVARVADGRTRVLHVAELAGTDASGFVLRDVFAFSALRTAAGGALEGSFHATGTVPRFVEEARGRGALVDVTIFERGTRLQRSRAPKADPRLAGARVAHHPRGRSQERRALQKSPAADDLER